MIRTLLIVTLLILSSCSSTSDRRSAAQIPELDAAANIVQSAVDDGRIPGAVLWVQQQERHEVRTFGMRSLEPERQPNRADTIYDVASLTKVVATAPSIMILAERGRLDIDAPVSRYIEEFSGGRREGITLRHLLTHTSGLPPGLSLSESWDGYQEGITRAVSSQPRYEPGRVFVYSDVNFILLGEIVRKVSGSTLDSFARENIFAPLQMIDTGFSPERRARVAPTQRSEGEMLQATVHDPTSRRMGGVAGHAGLFSTAKDLATYARMLLNRGELDGIRVMSSTSVGLMTSVATPGNGFARRGLGWDYDSGFSRPRGGFPVGSFGHTGWTGSFLWIDPVSRSFYVLLSNRVHPDGRGSVIDLQYELGRAVSGALIGRAEVAEGVRVEPAPSGDVMTGVDVLSEGGFELMQGRRVAVITNHTGRDRRGNPTADLIGAAHGVELVAIFSPEHGFRGVSDELVADGVHEASGLPVWSLYGERRAPASEQLEEVDDLVFDIQDIGARYYTYISTMGLAMRAAADAGKRFIVLDRPNPIGGDVVEGPVAEGESTFTSFHPIAMRHGMTVGELARMFADELKLDIDLHVVEMRGWSRDELWNETGLPWVNPSPNIRNPRAALLYPALGFLESTNLSVGRGTATPFEIFGAPWMDAEGVAADLSREVAAECASFEPVAFTPASSVFRNEESRGVRIRLHDPRRCEMVKIGLIVAHSLRQRHPEQWDFARASSLLRSRNAVEAIGAGMEPEAIEALWQSELREFEKRRSKYLLYE